MDTNGISTVAGSLGPAASTSRRAALPAIGGAQSTSDVREQPVTRGRRAGHALQVLRHELRFALKAYFKARFAATPPGYGDAQPPATADDVVGEALGAAQQLAQESPTTAAKSLIRFRAQIRESATAVRETLAPQDELDDVDDALAKLDGGLDELDAVVTQNRESSASVMEIDTRTKQRSTIRIRTQEGDIVRFDLKRVDRLSATDASVSNEDGFASLTSVEMSSRTRLMLRVNGDLNDNELAAIQNVFAQAEQIANDFYGGDIGAAFNSASGFEFDTGQLARVNMRFGLRQSSTVTITERIEKPVEAAPAPWFAPVSDAPRIPAARAPEPPASVAADAPVTAPADADAAPIAAPAEALPADVVPPDAAPPALDTSALGGFFELISSFFRSVGEGFEAEGFRFHYSESFKLELLKAVFVTSAPDDAGDAADNAAALLDTMGQVVDAERDDD